jgi:hypothetical protein
MNQSDGDFNKTHMNDVDEAAVAMVVMILTADPNESGRAMVVKIPMADPHEAVKPWLYIFTRPTLMKRSHHGGKDS